jgi:hypothetical protein
VIEIHATARVSPHCDIEDSVRGSRIVVGAGSVIDSFVKIKPTGGSGDLVIGEQSVVNSGCVLYTGNGISIGDHVAIAANTTFAPVNHAYRDRARLIAEQGFQPAGAASSSRTTSGSAPTACCSTARVRARLGHRRRSLVRGEVAAYTVHAGNPLVRLASGNEARHRDRRRRLIGRRPLAHLPARWDCRSGARRSRIRPRGRLGTVFHCAGLTADFARRPHDTVRPTSACSTTCSPSPASTPWSISSTRSTTAGPDSPAPRSTRTHRFRSTRRSPPSLRPSNARRVALPPGERWSRPDRPAACVYSGGDDDADGFLGTPLSPPAARPRRGAGSRLVGEAARDYVHVDDVARGAGRDRGRGTRPLYNVAGGVNVANRELFARLGELAGCELAPCATDRRPARPGLDCAHPGRVRLAAPALLDRLPGSGEAVPC